MFGEFAFRALDFHAFSVELHVGPNLDTRAREYDN